MKKKKKKLKFNIKHTDKKNNTTYSTFISLS